MSLILINVSISVTYFWWQHSYTGVWIVIKLTRISFAFAYPFPVVPPSTHPWINNLNNELLSQITNNITYATLQFGRPITCITGVLCRYISQYRIGNTTCPIHTLSVCMIRDDTLLSDQIYTSSHICGAIRMLCFSLLAFIDTDRWKKSSRRIYKTLSP